MSLQEESLRVGLSRLIVPSLTLPPATSTNAWLLGEKTTIIVDPSAKGKAGHIELGDSLEKYCPEAIFLTHHHQDHINSVSYLRERFGCPVIAHPETAKLVPFDVDQEFFEGQVLTTDTEEWQAFHTPGHAPGHLCLLSGLDRTLVAGDMVAGEGTILIQPSEGSIREYISSLERLKTFGTSRLLPAHGAALEDPEKVLSEYIAHRKMRVEQVLGFLGEEPLSTLNIAEKIYTELPVQFLIYASIQVECGLIWLEEEGLARRVGERWVCV